MKDDNCLTEDLANQMFLEAQELLKSSPWISNITGEERLSETKEDKSSVASNTHADDTNKYNDVDNITDIHFTSDDLDPDINHFSQAITDNIQSCPLYEENTSKLANEINSSPNTTRNVHPSAQALSNPYQRSVIQTPYMRK